jgi:hypothetical protein
MYATLSVAPDVRRVTVEGVGGVIMRREVIHDTIEAPLFIGSVLALLLVAVLVITNIPRIAVLLAPKNAAAAERSTRALAADSLFWRIFHSGAYDQLPLALEAITAAYLENPRDAVTASHAGFLHVSQSAEASRLDTFNEPRFGGRDG